MFSEQCPMFAFLVTGTSEGLLSQSDSFWSTWRQTMRIGGNGLDHHGWWVMEGVSWMVGQGWWILNIVNSQLEHFILYNSLFIQVQIDPSILELGRLFNLMKRIFWNIVYLQLENCILTYNCSTRSILLVNPIKNLGSSIGPRQCHKSDFKIRQIWSKRQVFEKFFMFIEREWWCIHNQLLFEQQPRTLLQTFQHLIQNSQQHQKAPVFSKHIPSK